MTDKIELGEITIDVVRKNIKNVHLSIYPPTGRVRISAPTRMSLDTIRVFAISKLDWIKRHQRTIREQERETPREYLDRESHFVWGKRYLLTVLETDGSPSIQLEHSRMVLRLRAGTDEAKRQAIVDEWYREQIKQAVPTLVAKWESIMGVRLDRFFVRRMKTRWGSCTPSSRSIRLNTELAKKPIECLEYVIVHELTHMLEPTHNARFASLLDQLMPQWRFHRDQLNRLPVRHEEWTHSDTDVT